MSDRPFRTGFCNPSNDPASHARCTLHATRPCSCECHTPRTLQDRVTDALLDEWMHSVQEQIRASPREHCERLARVACTVLEATS